MCCPSLLHKKVILGFVMVIISVEFDSEIGKLNATVK